MREDLASLNTVNRILEGERTKAYSLPPALLKAAKTASALGIALENHGRKSEGAVTPDAALEALVDQLVSNVTAKGRVQVPDTSAVPKARQALEEEEIVFQVLTRARARGDRALIAAARDHAEAIVVEHLRPALEDTLRKVRKAAGHLQGFEETVNVDLMAAAPEQTRKAFLEVGELARRYGAIRGARAALEQLGYQAERDKRFGEFRNFMELWPSFGTNVQTSAPWPEDARARLLWIATGPAVAWMPTPEEQDTRFDAYVESRKPHRDQAVGVASL